MKKRTLADKFNTLYYIFAVLAELFSLGCASTSSGRTSTVVTPEFSTPRHGQCSWVVIANGHTNVVVLTESETRAFMEIVSPH